MPTSIHRAALESPPCRRGELAFTLIELLVVMVLIGIVGALVSTGLITGLDGASKSMLDRRSAAEFQGARELLEKDLRSAQAPGRDFDLISNRQDLKDELLTGNSALPAGLDVMDVKAATPTSLTFVADVINTSPTAAAAPECVTWALGGTATRWWLSRDVRAYSPGCGGAGTGAYVIKPQNVKAGAPAPTGIFSYVLTCGAAACAPGSSCSAATPQPTVSGDAMNWITGVRMDISSIITRGNNASARARLQSSVALRGRLSDDYLFALGCLEQ